VIKSEQRSSGWDIIKAIQQTLTSKGSINEQFQENIQVYIASFFLAFFKGSYRNVAQLQLSF